MLIAARRSATCAPRIVDPPPTVGSVNVAAKLALTDTFAFTVTAHVSAVPVHAPLHPRKVAPLAGAAVRVTVVPLLKLAEHVPLPQLMPPGLLVTVPAAEPRIVTLRSEVGCTTDSVRV